MFLSGFSSCMYLFCQCSTLPCIDVVCLLVCVHVTAFFSLFVFGTSVVCCVLCVWLL
jgi:hypothetical protein